MCTTEGVVNRITAGLVFSWLSVASGGCNIGRMVSVALRGRAVFVILKNSMWSSSLRNGGAISSVCGRRFPRFTANETSQWNLYTFAFIAANAESFLLKAVCSVAGFLGLFPVFVAVSRITLGSMPVFPKNFWLCARAHPKHLPPNVPSLQPQNGTKGQTHNLQRISGVHVHQITRPSLACRSPDRNSVEAFSSSQDTPSIVDPTLGHVNTVAEYTMLQRNAVHDAKLSPWWAAHAFAFSLAGQIGSLTGYGLCARSYVLIGLCSYDFISCLTKFRDCPRPCKRTSTQSSKFVLS